MYIYVHNTMFWGLFKVNCEICFCVGVVVWCLLVKRSFDFDGKPSPLRMTVLMDRPIQVHLIHRVFPSRASRLWNLDFRYRGQMRVDVVVRLRPIWKNLVQRLMEAGCFRYKVKSFIKSILISDSKHSYDLSNRILNCNPCFCTT